MKDDRIIQGKPADAPYNYRDEELEKKALALYNSDKSPLCFLVTSAGSVGYTPSHCERCHKKFRLWRKSHTIYNKKDRFKLVCIDCIDVKNDKF